MRPFVEDLLVDLDAPLRRALEVLDRTCQGIVFVVDARRVLHGVLTAGDIRRALLRSASLDTNASTLPNKDEWSPNVVGDTLYVATDFQSQQPPPVNFEPHDKDSCHAPRLHGVMISLIAKSKDPDPTYKSTSALGYRTMNSPVTVNPPYPDVAQYPTISTEPHFRRRVQTLKINLRNYAYPG